MRKLVLLFFCFLMTSYVLADARYEIDNSLIKKDNRRDTEPNIQESQIINKLRESSWDEEWLVIPSTEIDNTKLQEILKDSVNKYQNIYEEMLETLSILKQLQLKMGKKLTDEKEKTILVNIISKVKNPKLKQKAEKDFSKGTISKSIKEELLEAIDISERDNNSFLDYTLNPINKDPFSFFVNKWTSKGWTSPKITYYDTVPNPLYRKNLSLFSYYDILNKFYYFPKLNESYTWINDETGEKIEEKYPERITYLRYSSHPELRILKNNNETKNLDFAEIYNNKGELVGINFPINIEIRDFDRTSIILKKVAKIAYLDNKHDIQSIDKEDKDFLTLELGLRDKNASERREENALGAALVSGNSKRTSNALMSMALDRMLKYDKAKNWLDQIVDDNKYNFRMILGIERLNPRTFKVSYGDDEGNPTYDVTYTYSTNKPYQYSRNIDIEKSKYDKNKEPINFDLKLVSGIDLRSIKHEYKTDEEIFVSTDQPGEFPGGVNALLKWLNNNVRYPETALQNDIEGQVMVKFVIEKDGSLSNVEISEAVDKDLDREALRVVSKMPKWQPAKNEGVVVRSYYNLPVLFQLSN